MNDDNVTYFERVGAEYNPEKKSKRFKGNKIITTSIHRIQADDSIIRGYFCIGFIDFMLKGMSLLVCTILFSPNEHENNNKTILKFFQ